MLLVSLILGSGRIKGGRSGGKGVWVNNEYIYIYILYLLI